MGTLAEWEAVKAFHVGGEQCRDWPRSSELEWLETNGTGGFAMGSVAGANTRRYHGLLVASLRPPVDRVVLLSRVEEELLCNGESTNLGACQYPGTISPAGFQLLEDFRLDPFPTWTYNCTCAQVEKRVFLIQGRQAVVLQYHVNRDCRLRVRPFLAFRDYHWLQHSRGDWKRETREAGNCLSVQPLDGMPELRFFHNSAGFVPVAHWYHNVEYRKEMDRGMEFREDLYSPGWFDFELKAGETAWLVATIEDLEASSDAQVRAWEKAEREQRSQLPKNTGDEEWDALRTHLEVAADQFVVRRRDGSPTIIAGYPWFTDWGRDTMISVTGLLLSRGRFDAAVEMIDGFLDHLDQGLIPNRFPDAGEKPEYNTADGTLWMFPAAWELDQAGSAKDFLRTRFYPAAREIIEWHRRGTHFAIQVDPADGLLSAGGPGTQLTWMDAKVGDWVVTPRHGKPVEINALWYNALRMTAAWAARFGDRAVERELTALADRVRASFDHAFWNAARGCLYDRLAPEGPDDRVRPNQIFAISLPFPLLTDEQRRSVVAVVTDRLLTPVGLRTLEPGHPDYKPRYQGGPLERDGAYHQGTVWPWLLGPYLAARLTAFGPGERSACRRMVLGLAPELERLCLGSLAEIYDADPPHRAVGAPAQAWSVAELLRAVSLLS